MVDSYVAEITEAVARRLTATGLRGEYLRERLHLDPFMKDEFERRSGVRPLTRKLATSAFPGLGPVDLVVAEPAALIELKWAYHVPGKIFESVWDVIKLAALGASHGCDALYAVTGAPASEWAVSESADLFESGEVDPAELWARPLVPKRGPNYGATVGQDLIIGARGNRPRRVHQRIAVRVVSVLPVANDFQLRVIGVAGVGPLVDWPEAPEADGRTPAGEELTVLDSVDLPPRVTQAWIERTAPRLAPAAVAPFLRALHDRGWSDADLADRVRPHLRHT